MITAAIKDWFTLPPSFRTKAKLLQMVDQAPPPLEEGEHVLWVSPAGDKRLTFTVHGEDEYRITVAARLDAQMEPWLTREEVRHIVRRIEELIV